VNTLKSAALVVVLLGVLYGVYVVLSKPHMLAPVAPAAAPGEDLGPPLVDFSGSGGHDHATAPSAANSVAPSRGSYQPSLDSPASLPPPTTVPPTDFPADPSLTSAAGSTRRSSYDAPAPAASGGASHGDAAPPLEPAANSSTAPSEDPAADPARAAALTAWSLRRDLQAAEQLVADSKFPDALIKLSPYHRHPDLTSDDQSQLTAWLDALAAKVIYSREHLLATPYEVRRNETLDDIARRHQVPWMLLASINREVVNDPQILVPGTQLKVVPGPFRADVSLAAGEVTLFLGEMYAGRFPFALGNEPPQPGSYKVQDKLNNRTYYAADGRTIPANDPSNPYGGAWIDLGHEVCIHGSPIAPAGPAATLGCISLSPQDARDVFGILSVGSDVTIRR
jgi:lipoprotein-anchoring transpeptidase ErfK/SrfK